MTASNPCLLVLSLVLLAGCATRPQQPPSAAAAQPHCLQDTGTRIEPHKGDCVAASGRSYSREDLQGTGMATTAEAIRRKLP